MADYDYPPLPDWIFYDPFVHQLALMNQMAMEMLGEIGKTRSMMMEAMKDMTSTTTSSRR